MDTDTETSTPGRATRIGRWGWQRRVVLGILVAIGLYYAVAFPLVTGRLSLIPLGLVFVVLAIGVTMWWPHPSARDKTAQ